MIRRTLLSVMAVAVLVGGCTGDDDAGPAPTTDPTVPTTVIDRSGVALAGVRGTTTSTIREVGRATISGSVQGPAGLVPGATVRIERLVAGREVRTDVLTGPDGRFTLGTLPGGRYRVRAFLAPSLAQTKPEIRFLADGKEHTFDLAVEQHGGLIVRADVAPDTPLLDGPVNLVALVATRSVGADGIVRATPVVGASVELVGLGRWQLRSDGGSSSPDPDADSTSTSFPFATTTTTTSRSRPTPTGRTDSSGRARFELRCESTGDPGLALRVPVTVASPPDPSGAPTPPQVTTQTVSLDLPSCVDPTATTTTTTGDDSSSSTSTSTPTSTTRP